VLHRDVIWWGGAVGEAFAPPPCPQNLKIVTFGVFAYKILFFLHFAPPPKGVGQNFAPPKKTSNDLPGFAEPCIRLGCC